MRYAIDRDHASEIFQEGFIRVFEALHTFKGESSLKTWMSRVFIYTAINYLRKEKRNSELTRLDVIYNQLADDEGEDIAEDGFANESFDHDPEMVLDCMATLPENYRLVLNLFAIDGLSHAQIGQSLGIAESHSRVILTRARKMLVGILTKKNVERNVAGHRR